MSNSDDTDSNTPPAGQALAAKQLTTLTTMMTTVNASTTAAPQAHDILEPDALKEKTPRSRPEAISNTVWRGMSTISRKRAWRAEDRRNEGVNSQITNSEILSLPFAAGKQPALGMTKASALEDPSKLLDPVSVARRERKAASAQYKLTDRATTHTRATAATIPVPQTWISDENLQGLKNAVATRSMPRLDRSAFDIDLFNTPMSSNWADAVDESADPDADPWKALNDSLVTGSADAIAPNVEKTAEDMQTWGLGLRALKIFTALDINLAPGLQVWTDSLITTAERLVRVHGNIQTLASQIMPSAKKLTDLANSAEKFNYSAAIQRLVDDRVGGSVQYINDFIARQTDGFIKLHAHIDNALSDHALWSRVRDMVTKAFETQNAALVKKLAEARRETESVIEIFESQQATLRACQAAIENCHDEAKKLREVKEQLVHTRDIDYEVVRNGRAIQEVKLAHDHFLGIYHDNYTELQKVIVQVDHKYAQIEACMFQSRFDADEYENSESWFEETPFVDPIPPQRNTVIWKIDTTHDAAELPANVNARADGNAATRGDISGARGGNVNARGGDVNAHGNTGGARGGTARGGVPDTQQHPQGQHRRGEHQRGGRRGGQGGGGGRARGRGGNGGGQGGGRGVGA